MENEDKTTTDAFEKAVLFFSSRAAQAEHRFIEDFLTMGRNIGLFSEADLRHFSTFSRDLRNPKEPDIWLHFGKEQLAVLRSSFPVIEQGVKIWVMAQKIKEADVLKKRLKDLY